MSCLLLAVPVAVPAAGAVTLNATDWPAPHEVVRLARHVELAVLVQELVAHADRTLVIRHAGGEVGSGFAVQLRDALVVLGVPSARMRFEPAAAGDGQLILELVENGRPLL